jgi:uncharacterized protein YkwD
MGRGWFLALLIGVNLSPAAQSSGDDENVKAALDRDEARTAIDYLNKVRKEPAKFSKELGIDLNNVMARAELSRNNTLVKVAEEKALDMANRDYFDHLTPEGLGINTQIHEAGYKLPSAWIKDKKQNFFESISAGQKTGIEAIRSLLVDRGDPESLHRKHLLGMTDFYAECTDIGIGFARHATSKYRTYMSIIIARRK